ncbi:MAG: hypothetical protein AAF514_22045, partial [Verrucomicrobiota bacterium]
MSALTKRGLASLILVGFLVAATTQLPRARRLIANWKYQQAIHGYGEAKEAERWNEARLYASEALR